MMKLATRRRQGGATRLELAVATILATLLTGLLLERLIAYHGETERVAAKQLVSSLRMALAVRSAQAIAHGGSAALMTLAHQNPIAWLEKRPKNYLGEYFSPQKAHLPTGHWYFDRAARTLVYLPSTQKTFSVGIQKVLVFKVELLRGLDPVEPDGRREVSTGLVLDQMDDQSLAFHNTAVTVPH